MNAGVTSETPKLATDELARKPDDAETLLLMEFAVMERDSWMVDNRQERAIVYFWKALELKPDFAKAQYEICKAYMQPADTFNDRKKNVAEEQAELMNLIRN